MHPTNEYATSVVYGDMVVGKWEKLACKRHLNDLDRSKTDETFPYVFDESRANRIFDWFMICRHVRGVFAGHPIELDQWQKFVFGCVMGWVDKKTGVRRFKTAYIRIARGNAKSTMMSGLANYGMCSDSYYAPTDVGITERYVYEVKPEVVCGAVDKEQAAIVWGDAREMALASPDINKRLNIAKATISHKVRGGAIKKLSKDTKNKDGGAPCMIIIDEYHAHPTSLVKDVTSSGKGKRQQCLEFIITTAGEDAENKPCKKEDDIVKKILDGTIINEKYFGIIFEIDDEDDPHDEKLWIKANPIFRTANDYSRTLYDQIKEEHDFAFQSGDPSKKRQWMIKRVDRWQKDCQSSYMGSALEIWKSLAVSRSEFASLTHGKRAVVGVDMGLKRDLTADGHVIPLDDGRYAITAHGFIPTDTADSHEKTDRVPYRDWAADGWCTLTPGAVTDDDFVEKHIETVEAENSWSVNEFCFDPYQMHQLSNRFEAKGFTKVDVRQGVISLNAPTKGFRDLVLQRKIVHDGNPVLTWCISNAMEIIDSNGNIKLSKKNKDCTQRIDLIAAVINAMYRINIAENTESIYERRGMIIL